MDEIETRMARAIARKDNPQVLDGSERGVPGKASYRAAYIAATNPSALSVVVDPNWVMKRQQVDTIEREFF